MKDASLQKIEAGDQFELAVDFLDLLESAIKMKKNILASFDLGGRSHSLTNSGQCRLSALVPLTNDTSRLLDLLTKLLRLLHVTLTWDMLSGHRTRFQSLYSQLGPLYEQISNFQYLRSVMQIPRLSGDISHYMKTLRQLADRNETAQQEEVEEVLFDDNFGAASETNDLISVADESVDASMAYIQQEYSDLSSRYQMVLQMLEQEQNSRRQDQQGFESREQQLKDDLDSAKRSLAEYAANNTLSEADAKLEKLKVVYQKLRADHITVLRQKGESEKRADDLQKRLDGNAEMDAEILNCLKDFLIRNHFTWDGKDATELKSSLSQLEDKITSMGEALAAKNKTIDDLKVQATKAESLDALQGELNGMTADRDKAVAEANNLKNIIAKTEASWREHMDLELGLLGEFLHNEATMSGGTPNLSNMFGMLPETPTGSEGPDFLSFEDKCAFFLLMTLSRLAPYSNTDTVQLDRLYNLGDSVVEALKAKSGAAAGWQDFCREASSQLKKIEGASFDPSESVDREIDEMQNAIQNAAEAMEKLMNAARANEAKKPNIDVDLKIIDSCGGLLSAIQVLIIAARDLQNEIAQDSGTFSKEFYRKNQKWSEGLISAAKDIGGGAKYLVEAANNVVTQGGKFEEVIAASQEISASTAQMVLASRVKARKGSQKLDVLSSKSKVVGEATAQVIATCRACARQIAEKEDEVDLEKLSVHETKKLEMEIQIKVLELETGLENQRKRLFALRKLQYAKSEEAKKERGED